MDRVIDHDLSFRLSDPWVTREFRVMTCWPSAAACRPMSSGRWWGWAIRPTRCWRRCAMSR